MLTIQPNAIPELLPTLPNLPLLTQGAALTAYWELAPTIGKSPKEAKLPRETVLEGKLSCMGHSGPCSPHLCAGNATELRPISAYSLLCQRDFTSKTQSLFQEASLIDWLPS